jgi:hypothetical protein
LKSASSKDSVIALVLNLRALLCVDIAYQNIEQAINASRQQC